MIRRHRLVAAVCVVALGSGCAVTRSQRRILVGTGAAVTVATALYALSFFFQECAPAIDGTAEECEIDRIDRRNRVAAISLGALVGTIGLQLLPVTDPERPPPPPVVMAPPPPPPPTADKLHDPVAITLATNARNYAAAGKCTEAYGSLKALASIDRAMADQLRAWDPAVSRCRPASAVEGSAAPSLSDVAPGQTAPSPGVPSPGQ